MKTMTADALAAGLHRPDGAWPYRGWALFDVREQGEAERGHIPSATPLPRRLIEFRLPELVPAKRTRIVVYDSGKADDRRAVLAARTMRLHGYEGACVLAGGLEAWRAIGERVFEGVNVPCKEFGERVLAEDGVPYVDADALNARLADGKCLAVCDVRTLEEYETGHVPGGYSTPGFELALRLGDFGEANEGIVVNCAGRTRSIIATATLRQLGARNVWALENGTMGWRLAGRKLESGSPPALPAESPEGRRVVRSEAASLARAEGARRIAADELAELCDGLSERNGYIFDVRSLVDFRAGHIPGAVALPGGQAVQRADDFAAVPGAPVVFVDDGDARAWLAAYWYGRMGFPDVRVLDGGVSAWSASGRELEEGRGRADPLGFEVARRRVKQIEATALAAHLKGRVSPVLLDVGTSRHYAAGHIADAHWVPRGWLEARAGAHGGHDTPVVVTAADPRQALLAAATLLDLGYVDVRALKGGNPAWKSAGLPLETGLPEGCEDPGDVVEPPYHKGRDGMLRYLEWETRLGRKYAQ
ncbi:rhodanese-like domain-containing protein [Ferruginivarius sediminum]|uniref:Sulfurtransferase n=1 Tax=Ferruginivarius sediminum TaxID=2661937 RepID=A0A369THG1_9PROT|nr:rhodanese-like domain-containing protein [Ferruginivarius sediminum]RDD62346.1 sulfurtransferase [Ferruginivarius sediminum]